MTHPTGNRSLWPPWRNGWSRGVGLVTRAALVCALLSAPQLATANEPAVPDPPGIPPGQENLLAAMLGRGTTLPGGCSFVAGQVDHSIIQATYACAGGPVVIQLAHPSSAPAPAIQTANFAVMLQSGVPPDGLAQALGWLIRAREADVEWTWPADEDASDDAAADAE